MQGKFNHNLKIAITPLFVRLSLSSDPTAVHLTS